MDNVIRSVKETRLSGTRAMNQAKPRGSRTAELLVRTGTQIEVALHAICELFSCDQRPQAQPVLPNRLVTWPLPQTLSQSQNVLTCGGACCTLSGASITARQLTQGARAFQSLGLLSFDSPALWAEGEHYRCSSHHMFTLGSLCTGPVLRASHWSFCLGLKNIVPV